MTYSGKHMTAYKGQPVTAESVIHSHSTFTGRFQIGEGPWQTISLVSDNADAAVAAATEQAKLEIDRRKSLGLPGSMQVACTPETRTLDEIQALVLAEVREHEEFAEVTPGRPYWHEPDEEGCNWWLSAWRGNQIDVELAWKAVRPAVQSLRRQYRAPTP